MSDSTKPNGRVWTYVITTDANGAPNYDPPAVTLTICKPKIRALAERGDMVIAFAGGSVHEKRAKADRRPHSVVWAGVVDQVLPFEDYWAHPEFRVKRPTGRDHMTDNIYEPMPDGSFKLHPNQAHDERSLKTDTGGKNALVFHDRVWRFDYGAFELPDPWNERLNMASPNHRRGQRRHHYAPEEVDALASLLAANGLPARHHEVPSTVERTCAPSSKRTCQ